jgi:hypothetical protein
MVYSILEVIHGFVINKEELRELLDLEDEDDLADCNLIGLFDDEFAIDFGKKINLYNFPCCSESRDQLFIIGESVHTYYRKLIRCEDCPGPRIVCDHCIGYTNNGYYDVIAILKQPVAVDVRHICSWCFHDNRQDLNGTLETAPVVDDPSQKRSCDVCGSLPGKYQSDSLVRVVDSILMNIQKENHWKKEIQFYYMVDDCLSCT